jgi:hypothetical protein
MNRNKNISKVRYIVKQHFGISDLQMGLKELGLPKSQKINLMPGIGRLPSISEGDEKSSKLPPYEADRCAQDI